MRDKDVLTAAYLKNNSRFADLLNGWLFGGRSVVRPEDIQELDSAEIRIRRQEHRERKDLKAEEYLSGISREDRFLPVVTLVLYFGKHWDGPRNLKDLLDLEGICASAASACSAGSGRVSHVQLAIGNTEEAARSAVRFTLGIETTKEEIDITVDTVRRLTDKLRGR